MFNQVFNRADSLYANGDYTDFIRFSKNELLQNPDLRNDYATVIKLAEASLQEEKYDLAEKVFDRAKELDSLLNDFIDYKKIQISLLKKDTVRYFDQVDRFIDRYPEFILNKNILKESIALGAHDRYYQRLLRYLSDSEKLELDVQQLKHMVMIRDSLRWDFIEKNKDF